MHEGQWIHWTRTPLRPREREALSTRLRERDYIWVDGVGVSWNPPHGDPLRRARFTHGDHLQTRREELDIDSEGTAAHEIPDRGEARAGGEDR